MVIHLDFFNRVLGKYKLGNYIPFVDHNISGILNSPEHRNKSTSETTVSDNTTLGKIHG